VANWVINNLRAKHTEDIERQKAEQTQVVGLGLLTDANTRVGESEPVITTLVKFPPPALMLEFFGLVEAKTISNAAAQQVFAEMYATDKAPGDIVREKGLAQVSDTGAIEKFCDEAIAANPNPVADYRAGKQAALNALKGYVMKLSKGKANPGLVGEILARKLKS